LTDMDPELQTRVEAATFRRLIAHLDGRKDVQNIDLMILAGFCRNCLSKWYAAAAQTEGVEMGLETAREQVYGMPYPDWKTQFQQAVPEEKVRAYEATQVKS
jgi:hypothetical protein